MSSSLQPRMASLTALLAFAAGQSVARAGVLSWNNTLGGSAATAGNWSPTAVPTALDDLVYSLSANYPVTFTSATSNSRTMVFRHGGVDLTMSPSHLTSFSITVGDQAGDSTIVGLTGGTWNSAGNLVVGRLSGSTGFLTVQGRDSDLLINGAGADCTIGDSGDAVLSIAVGGLLEVNDLLFVGSNSTSTPQVTVGGVATGFPIARSTLRVLGTGQSRFGAGGDTSVNIIDGGLVDFAGSLVIANGSASVSQVTVAGAGGILNSHARLQVDGDLSIGRNTSNSTAAGAGTLTVNNEGDVVVGGTLFLASDPDGGSATLTTAAGSLVHAHSLTIGNTATLNLQGGTINVDGGTLVWTNSLTPFTLNGAAVAPVFSMINGATATLSPVLTGDAMRLGAGAGNNTAEFRVLSGSTLTFANGGRLAIADAFGDTGTLTVSGAGTSLSLSPNLSTLSVGSDGSGTMTIDQGAQAEGNTLFIGINTGGVGSVRIADPGTVARFTNTHVGTLGGGSANLVVDNQAVLSSHGSGGVWGVGTGSSMTISNGASVGSGDINMDFRDDLLLNNAGNIQAAQMIGRSGGRLESRGSGGPASLVDSRVELQSGSSLVLTTGDLIIGSDTFFDGFVALPGSSVSVGSRSLTLRDSDAAELSVMTIAGGSVSSSHGIQISNGGSIDGFGTISNDVSFNGGAGVITSASPGITFQGMLRNLSGSIDGTNFRFTGPGSGWTGAGAINARASFEVGSTISAMGNMTIGAAFTDGVTLAGTLDARDKTVTLIDTNGVVLGPTTILGLDNAAEGRVVHDNQLTLNVGRTLEGRGTLDSPVISISGNLRPGERNNAGPGVLRLSNAPLPHTTTFGASADLELDFFPAPPIPGAVLFDALDVDGTLQLNGRLTVQPHTTSLPISRTVWVVVAADVLSGTFSSVSLPPRFTLSYSPTGVLLTFCPPDFNNSGTVTVQDIFDYLAAYFSAAPGADFNSSGAITVQDIFDFLAAYFAGC